MALSDLCSGDVTSRVLQIISIGKVLFDIVLKVVFIIVLDVAAGIFTSSGRLFLLSIGGNRVFWGASLSFLSLVSSLFV